MREDGARPLSWQLLCAGDNTDLLSGEPPCLVRDEALHGALGARVLAVLESDGRVTTHCHQGYISQHGWNELRIDYSCANLQSASKQASLTGHSSTVIQYHHNRTRGRWQVAPVTAGPHGAMLSHGHSRCETRCWERASPVQLCSDYGRLQTAQAQPWYSKYVSVVLIRRKPVHVNPMLRCSGDGRSVGVACVMQCHVRAGHQHSESMVK